MATVSTEWSPCRNSRNCSTGSDGIPTRDGKADQGRSSTFTVSVPDRMSHRKTRTFTAPVIAAMRRFMPRSWPRKRIPESHQYHLYRDIRTYGKYELLYDQSLETGSTYLRFGDDEPPVVEKCSDGKVKVTVKDLLTFGEEVEIKADVVVLVTGMVPRRNDELVTLLKLPVGRDRFFNEIHPKLRPVETMVDGVLICGACQGPKNSTETVASALAAATQSASILKKGYVELDPLMASVNPDLCDGCGECVAACPYAAIEMEEDRAKRWQS